MRTYVLKRLLLMIPTLFGVSVVVWLVVTSAPAPPISQQVPSAESGQERGGEVGGLTQAVKVFRAQYGLDKPKLLNLYYSLDLDEVRRTLSTAADLDGKRKIKEKSAAQEQLIEWGRYAVPSYLALARKESGALRDRAISWFVQTAQRVAVAAEGGEVSAERARENAAIVKENRVLDLYKIPPEAPEAQREARVDVLGEWFDGAQKHYAEKADTEEVRKLLRAGDAKSLEALGSKAVGALVRLIDDEGVRDQAVAWLPRLGKRAETGDDRAKERARLVNATLETMVWQPTDPESVKTGGAEVVRGWWTGRSDQWDYSGLRKLKVIFLETQFATYWKNLLRFDLGMSLTHKVPVLTLIGERLKYSLTLALSSLILAYLISVPFGIVAARAHNSLFDRVSSVFIFALYSLPSFYVATMAITYLAKGQPGSLEWIPTGRFESLEAWRKPTGAWVMDIAHHVVAPILCMTYGSVAALSRYAKTGLLNVFRADYIRTARAKGLSEFKVVTKHAARNGLIPIITLLGATLPVIVGGSFIIEVIFNIPGFGQLTVQSIFNRDYNVIIGISLIVAVLTMVGLLLSDLLYAVVDPRISFS